MRFNERLNHQSFCTYVVDMVHRYLKSLTCIYRVVTGWLAAVARATCSHACVPRRSNQPLAQRQVRTVNYACSLAASVVVDSFS